MLRWEFWIIRERQVIKKFLHECLPCKGFKQKKREHIEVPLPEDRLNATKPFDITGIDFAGPLYVRKYQLVGKPYIVLFTCGITKAFAYVNSEVCCTSRITTSHIFGQCYNIPCGQ
ncbi:hypothetical protein AVEN_11292-1 [Araneus ventricosus]|uniref:Integrase zinc-binding domain-containing protein n=1 Tax=Araneus ventricosus TaxID=182803 RepID=A0A4Y2E1G3_ARAVE|nr:hypothetical protein AVEN_11292-1 [Araneus ventricosus]